MGMLLLIDPDPKFRESLEWIQKQFEVDIHSAAGLTEGIDVLRTRRVDLVVMDMFLPQKSGLSLIAEITSHDAHPPIIATFSAEHAPQINIKRFAHMLGVSYTFEKPVNAKHFQEAILELVPHIGKRTEK
jgi:DNA-binding response OmpR family regulator